jgi:hypothetical protein
LMNNEQRNLERALVLALSRAFRLPRPDRPVDPGSMLTPVAAATRKSRVSHRLLTARTTRTNHHNTYATEGLGSYL